MGSFKGKTALVTGGGRGIGRAVAERLARDGARVAVHYGNNDAAANDTVRAVENAGGSAFAIHAKLGVPGDAEALWAAFGEHADGVDIIVNNAGMSTDSDTIKDMDPDTFDELVAVNAKAPFFIIKYGLTRLRDGGRIINVSSAATRIAHPGAVVYSMTKAALSVLIQPLAWSGLSARGITVNAVSPGFIETDVTPWLQDPRTREWADSLNSAGRTGQPDDVAGLIAFLASDDARWVNGQTVDVSGGMLLGASQPRPPRDNR